jgi:hypothetical protein
MNYHANANASVSRGTLNPIIFLNMHRNASEPFYMNLW